MHCINKEQKYLQETEEYLKELNNKIRKHVEDTTIEVSQKSCWPIYCLCHLRSRYIYMQHKAGKITPEVFKRLCSTGQADKALISYWRKSDTEYLCCLRCIDSITKTGNTCLCRVPKKYLNSEERSVPCHTCGCSGCAFS